LVVGDKRKLARGIKLLLSIKYITFSFSFAKKKR
jgi:hypothetical protein